MEKTHGYDSGTTTHIERIIIPKNAAPTRTYLNRKLVAYPDGIKDRSAVFREDWRNGLTRVMYRKGGTFGRVVYR